MKRPRYFVLSILAVLLETAALHAAQQPAADPDPLTRTARDFIDCLAAGKTPDAVEKFDARMKKALPPAKLKRVWDSLIEQHGPFRGVQRTRSGNLAGYAVVYVTCQFERTSVDAKVVFNRAGQVGGLWFTPPTPGGGYEPPDYARPERFRDQEEVVGHGIWQLPGTLSLPNGQGPFPAVILVHGSGPQDRDETLGPNKPFRDLAWGLASRAIAVIRYEKRTKQHPGKMLFLKNRLTVKEEVIDDALAAVALARSTAGIDPDRVFVLGHSLGGMLAPRIAAADTKLAGAIILAGTSRPIEDVLLEQYTYVFSLDGTLSDAEKQQLAKLREQVARVKDPDLSTTVAAGLLPLSVPAAYWLDLRRYDPVEAARRLSVPMLILQGGRDYNVTMRDFARWEKALATRDDVVLKAYPGLNHLFAEGEGPSQPAEYQSPGHVADTVIEDIARWVLSRKR